MSPKLFKQYDYWFTITTRTLYKVRAANLEQAQEKLDETDDLADIYVSEESGEPEFYGSTNPQEEEH